MRKGVELALKIIFVACLVLVLVELKWLIQDQVFDRQELDSYLEKGVALGKRILAQGTTNGAIMVEHIRSSETWSTLFD